MFTPGDQRRRMSRDFRTDTPQAQAKRENKPPQARVSPALTLSLIFVKIRRSTRPVWSWLLPEDDCP
jgi:hypothetical protein